MFTDFRGFLASLNEHFTLYFVFPGIILLGLYLTLKLSFVQVSKFKIGFQHLLQNKSESQGSISHFEALSAVLAGNFGTGNISGMAVAITMGGPGALVWMWVMAFLGAVIQYASCLLGVKYRIKNEQGEYIGGPMVYLEKGLGLKKLGAFFAILTLFGAVSVGGLAQVNSMSLPLISLGIHPLFCGCVIALLVAFVLIGGLKRMARFASFVVPLKAILYLSFAIVILTLNRESIWPCLKLMFKSALGLESAIGGVLGYGVLKTLASGFDRGLFATDAGTGLVPILQSNARTKNPVDDGLVALVAPFMVMIVCTATGLILLTTGAWQTDLQSTNMVTYAFTKGLGSEMGGHLVIVALVLFGYTTILAWGSCAETAASYLGGAKLARWIKIIYIVLLPLGALFKVELVWTLADLCITAMLVTNMIGVAGLSSQVIQDSRKYFFDRKQVKSDV